MAGESPSIRQEDIEELLQQAQMAAGLAEQTTASPQQAGGAAAAGSLQLPLRQSSRTVQQWPLLTATRKAASQDLRPAAHDRRRHLAADPQAQQAIASVDQPADPGIPGSRRSSSKTCPGSPASGEKATLELLRDVDLDLRIELGRTQMHLEDVLKLQTGSVVPLDKLAGDPVDMYVNGRLIARGEVLVLNDNFCVRVAELVAGDDSSNARRTKSHGCGLLITIGASHWLRSSAGGWLVRRPSNRVLMRSVMTANRADSGPPSQPQRSRAAWLAAAEEPSRSDRQACPARAKSAQRKRARPPDETPRPHPERRDHHGLGQPGRLCWGCSWFSSGSPAG